MIKVLQIIDGKSFGGIAKLMYDVEKNISNEIKIDCLTAISICDKWHNLDISRETLNGRIIYNYRLFKFLKKNKYNIVHINSGAFFFTFQVAIVAKLAGIKKLIVHSHNTPHISKTKRFFITILNPLYKKMIDVKLTCSSSAAKSLFTKTDDVICIKNGIDIEKFKFDEKIRKNYRRQLNIENKFVYGHVGRFDKQKNHNFLIDIFYKIQKRKKDSVLLLVGNGELKGEIENKVKKYGIEDKVTFLGFRNDINNILNCMDVFIFPSIYEGLGMVVVEAQTNGLITYCSKEIPVEANISSNFKYFDLKESSESIAQKICEEKLSLSNRKDAYKNALDNGYDIKSVCMILTKIYKQLQNE